MFGFKYLAQIFVFNIFHVVIEGGIFALLSGLAFSFNIWFEYWFHYLVSIFDFNICL